MKNNKVIIAIIAVIVLLMISFSIRKKIMKKEVKIVIPISQKMQTLF